MFKTFSNLLKTYTYVLSISDYTTIFYKIIKQINNFLLTYMKYKIMYIYDIYFKTENINYNIYIKLYVVA